MGILTIASLVAANAALWELLELRRHGECDGQRDIEMRSHVDDALAALPKPHCVTFATRFADLIRRGAKTSTLRSGSVGMRMLRSWHAGDVLDLRTWRTQAYRSPQVTIAYAVLDSVSLLHLLDDRIDLIGSSSPDTSDDIDPCEFARAEGFGSYSDLLSYLRDNGWRSEPLTWLIWHIPTPVAVDREDGLNG